MSVTLDFRQPHVKDSKLQHNRAIGSRAPSAGYATGGVVAAEKRVASSSNPSPTSGEATDDAPPRQLGSSVDSESSEDSSLPSKSPCCGKGGRMFRLHILLLPVFIVVIGTVAVWWLDTIEHNNNQDSVLRALQREAVGVRRRLEEGMQEQVDLVSYMARNLKLQEFPEFSVPSNWDAVAVGPQNFVQLSTMTAYLARVHANETGPLADYLATQYANNTLVNSSKWKESDVTVWGDNLGCDNSRYVSTDIAPQVLPYLTALYVDFDSEKVRGEAISGSVDRNAAVISRPLPTSGSSGATLVHIAHPVYHVNVSNLTVPERCHAAAGVLDNIMSVTGFARQWLRDASLVGSRIRVFGCWQGECLDALACSIEEDDGEPVVNFDEDDRSSELHVQETVALPDGTSWTLEMCAFHKFSEINTPARSPLLATSISFFALLLCLSVMYTISVHRRTESLADDFQKKAISLTKDRREAKMLARRERDFLAYVFHEARVPFNAVTLGIQSLQNLPGQSAEARHILSLMEDGAGQTISILNDVLDMQRVEQGTFTLDYSPFCPAELIKASIWSFSAVADARHIRVTTDTHEDMVSTWVSGDHRRLKQVLDNLLSNAIKYTGDGGDVKVLLYTGRLRTEELSDIAPIDIDDGDPLQLTFTIEVADSGRGISEEDQENLFKPFVRAAKNETAGTGLGLSVAKAITQLHGGVIGCRSVLGEGSRFHITLPLQISEEVVRDDRSESDHKDTAEIRAVLTRLEILLVEDSRVSRTLMGVVFRQHGVSVLEFATNGLEAVQKVKARLAASQGKPIPRSALAANADADDSSGTAPKPLHAAAAAMSTSDQTVTSDFSELCASPSVGSNVSGDIETELVPMQSRSNRLRMRRLKRQRKPNSSNPDLADLSRDAARNGFGKLGTIHDTPVGANYDVMGLPGGGTAEHQVDHDAGTGPPRGSEMSSERRPSQCRMYDLILMDKTMPVMDGQQATIKIREMGIKTPIVFLTGNAFAEERDAFLAAGADGVLTKPFQSHAFFQALAELHDQGHFDHLKPSSP